MLFFLKPQAGWREPARIEAGYPEYYSDSPAKQTSSQLIEFTRMNDVALAELVAMYDETHPPEPPRPRQALIRPCPASGPCGACKGF